MLIHQAKAGQIIDTKPYGWKGCSSAMLVKLSRPRRFKHSGKCCQTTYAISARVNGVNYLYPANKLGTVRQCPALVA